MIHRTVFMVSMTLFLIFSCRENPKNASVSSLNQEVSIDDEKMLLGPIDLNGLQSGEYKTWFDSVYHEYSPLESTLVNLKEQLKDVEIKTFIGTWCSDSQRDLPALYRILDDLEYETKTLGVVGVNRDKDQPAENLDGFNIEYLPTFIFYKDNQELGRIIEIPDLTLEEDMLTILTKTSD